jgi:hypothetical protein
MCFNEVFEQLVLVFVILVPHVGATPKQQNNLSSTSTLF